MATILEDIGQEQGQEQEQEQETECLVCLQPCKELSVDLFLYYCSCVYPIHDTCFKQWRTISGSNRVCMICREELDYISEDEIQVVRLRRRTPTIEERVEENTVSYISGCCDYINKIILLVVVGVLIIIVSEMIVQLMGGRSRSKPS
jgi:hypothetical protein